MQNCSTQTHAKLFTQTHAKLLTQTHDTNSCKTVPTQTHAKLFTQTHAKLFTQTHVKLFTQTHAKLFTQTHAKLLDTNSCKTVRHQTHVKLFTQTHATCSHQNCYRVLQVGCQANVKVVVTMQTNEANRPTRFSLCGHYCLFTFAFDKHLANCNRHKLIQNCSAHTHTLTTVVMAHHHGLAHHGYGRC